MKMKGWLMMWAVLVVAGLAQVYAVTQNDGDLGPIGQIRVQSGGIQQFRVGTEPTRDASYRITQDSSPANGVNPYSVRIGTNGSVAFNEAPNGASSGTPSGVSIGRGFGGMFTLALSTASSAEIAAYQARAMGELIYNATVRGVCVSTGNVSIGQFAAVGSTTAISNLGIGTVSVVAPCY